MIPIDELFASSTKEEVLETWLTALEAFQIPARTWRKGGVALTILAVVAATYAAFTSLVATIAKGAFLDTATGASLTLLARFVYGVERRPATRATGQVRLDNAGGGLFTFGPGEFRVINPDSQATYVNAAAFTLSPLQTGLFVDVIAELAGSEGSALAGTITKIDTTASRVTCTNPAAVLGSDEESDAELAQACRDRVAAYGAGAPRGAYAFWARRATRLDGSFVDVNRVSVSPSSSTGLVVVHVASPAGTPAPADIAAVAAMLEAKVRPDSVTVDTFGAVSRVVPVAATVWVASDAGETDASVRAAALQALADLQRTWPIGGRRKGDGSTNGLFADRINAAIIASRPAIFDCDGVASDVPLLDNEIPVFVPDLSIRFEARS